MENFSKILRTKYWYLFTDEYLSRSFPKYKGPKIILTEKKDLWQIYHIDGFDYYWPVEFPIKGLYDLYCEVFAPYKLNAHAYERKNIKIKENDWVIDAGASEGFFVRYALLRNANVLAIEPIPRLAEALQHTYKKEITEGKVIVLSVGLGKKSGNSHLQINDQQICSSTISDGIGENVRMLSIDDIYRQKLIPKIDFLKMDIEGGEIDAILGAQMVLRDLKPRLSIAVYHSYQNASVIKNIIKTVQPKYDVSYRGIFIRDNFGQPRPFMLHAISH